MTVSARISPGRLAAHRAAGQWAGTLVDDHVTRRGSSDALAIVDGDRKIDYRELAAATRRIGAGLQRLGVARGDVVSWQLPNWHEAIVLHHAILRIGGVSNPIVPIYRRREVEFILRQARSRVFVVPETFRRFDYVAMVDEMRPRLDDLAHVVVVRGTSERPGTVPLAQLEDDEGPAPVPRAATDPAILLYTSGTTADPKGVVHTHDTLDYENRSLIELFAFTQDDRVFMPSPVSHVTGLLYGMQLPFMLGTSVVLQDVWEPGAALELIERHRSSFMVAATPFLNGLVTSPDLPRRDVSSLRVFWCGGADVPPVLVREASELLDCFVTRVYGSSEFPTAAIGRPDDGLERRATSDGRLIANVEARILDEDGEQLPAGSTGELVLRGPELFTNYLVEPPGEPTLLDGGWFPTGDLASLDDEGFLTIRGRKKDIILRGGENIGVKEVEDLLHAHPAVAEVAIVAMPDPVMTEKACAFVVPAGDRRPTLDDLGEFLRSHDLAIQKLPERVELVEALPKNLAGKIQKFKLRDEIRRLMAQEALR